MGDLKPCSRCECKDIPPQIELIRGTWIAWCEGCHTSTASKDRDECIKDWNTRPIEEQLADERDELSQKLKYAHDALRHIYSMGSTALDVRSCGCGSCSNARLALADAGCNVAYPPEGSCWSSERKETRAKLRRAVEACYLADMQFDCDCCMDGDDPIHMDDCVVPALCRAVAENADIVARIEEERGKETR